MQVERRVDVDRLGRRGRQPGILLGERLADEVDEVRRFGFERALDDGERLVRGAVGGVLRDVAGVDHRLQHDVAPLLAALRVVERRQRRRRLDDAGDRRRFGERDVADVLAEEQPRGFRHADDARTTRAGRAGHVAVFGVSEASRLFFGKEHQQPLAEARDDGRVIQQPSALSPFNNPQRSRSAATSSCTRWKTPGYVDKATAKSRTAEPLVVVRFHAKQKRGLEWRLASQTLDRLRPDDDDGQGRDC